MATFQEMQRQRDMYIQKVSELNVEHSEYRRVVEIIKPLDPARKCFQLINSVLVERTIAEVAPIVETSRDNIGALIKDLEGRHTKLVAEIRDFSQRFGSAWARRPQKPPPAGTNARAFYQRAPSPPPHYPDVTPSRPPPSQLQQSA